LRDGEVEILRELLGNRGARSASPLLNVSETAAQLVVVDPVMRPEAGVLGDDTALTSVGPTGLRDPAVHEADGLAAASLHVADARRPGFADRAGAADAGERSHV
jgi:hypothetical protein